MNENGSCCTDIVEDVLKDIEILTSFEQKEKTIVLKSAVSPGTTKKWNIEFVNTGLKSLTAKRIELCKKYLLNDDFFLVTYGDGVTNLNINMLTNLNSQLHLPPRRLLSHQLHY